MTRDELKKLENDIRRAQKLVELEKERVSRNYYNFGADNLTCETVTTISKENFSIITNHSWDLDPKIITVLDEIQAEIQRAVKKHGPINSWHETYGIKVQSRRLRKSMLMNNC